MLMKGRSMKVLLVDDSAVVRDRLVILLAETRGVEVVGHAAEAKEAVAACARLVPDALILELNLGRGSGFEVLERIMQTPPTPLLIVLTSHASPHYREKCLRSGAHFFFDKAHEFDKVVTVLQDR